MSYVGECGGGCGFPAAGVASSSVAFSGIGWGWGVPPVVPGSSGGCVGGFFRMVFRRRRAATVSGDDER